MVQEKQKREEKIGYKTDLPEHERVPLKYYVYLTENSLTEELLPRYKQLGITEIYVGFDHFHPDGLKEQNKNSSGTSKCSTAARKKETTVEKKYPRIQEKLDLLKASNIQLRRGNVMGASCETAETLATFYEVIEWASAPEQ